MVSEKKNTRTRFPKEISPKNIPSGSGIRDPEKIHSGSESRIQGVKKHRIPDPDTQHCLEVT
jgi:hypothetical protein